MIKGKGDAEKTPGREKWKHIWQKMYIEGENIWTQAQNRVNESLMAYYALQRGRSKSDYYK